MSRIRYKAAEEELTDSVLISENNSEKFKAATDDEYDSISFEFGHTSTTESSELKVKESNSIQSPAK